MPANIDKLIPQRSLIDLTSHTDGDFGFENYQLSSVLADILLVEFVDLSDDGESITRGGLVIPTNTLTKAWRKGRVVLVGPDAKYVKKNDIVMFPNNLGVAAARLDVEGYGIIKKGIFLNEDRIFSILKAYDNTEISA
jgi:co-chaperonin GroES (HSP10)